MSATIIRSTIACLDQARRLPKLVRFLALHAVFGVIVGCGLGALLLTVDVAGLGSLMVDSDMWLIAGLLYFSGLAVTFGGAMMSTAVLLQSEN